MDFVGSIRLALLAKLEAIAGMVTAYANPDCPTLRRSSTGDMYPINRVRLRSLSALVWALVSRRATSRPLTDRSFQGHNLLAA